MVSATLFACSTAARSAFWTTEDRIRSATGMANARMTSVVSPTTRAMIWRRMSPSHVRGGHQPNADSTHAVDVARVSRGLTELATQPGQVHVDRSVRATPGELPDLGEQVALGHYLARSPGQREQQVELLAGQIDRGPVDVRQPEVEEHDVGSLGHRRREGAHTGVDRVDGMPLFPKGTHQRRADRGVVLDEQDLDHCSGGQFGWSGPPSGWSSLGRLRRLRRNSGSSSGATGRRGGAAGRPNWPDQPARGAAVRAGGRSDWRGGPTVNQSTVPTVLSTTITITQTGLGSNRIRSRGAVMESK